MKWRITIKELTLLLGVLVALIVVLTIWINPLANSTGNDPAQAFPNAVLPAAKVLVEKVLLQLF